MDRSFGNILSNVRFLGELSRTEILCSILGALFKSTIIVSIILINPLGIKKTGQEQSEAIILDAQASSFEINENLAVIIVIDDEFINSKSLTYPITYLHLSKTLEQITDHKPRAVFIDILQHYVHSPNFDMWIEQLKESNKISPIYLAQDTEFDSKFYNHNSVRKQVSKYSKPSPVSWAADINRYPMMINKNTKTASLLLYENYCKTTHELCKNVSSNNFKETMIVRWNNSTHSKQGSFFNIPKECQKQKSSYYHSFYRHISYGYKSKKEIEEERIKCFPILTISAKELYNKERLFEIKSIIKDKFVFLGYDLLASNDKVVSPVHSQLPGVFFHAMSFLNLVSLGENYWKSPTPIIHALSQHDINQAYFQLIILFISFASNSLLKKSLSNKPKNKTNLLYNLKYIITVTTSISIAFFIFQSTQDNFNNINWVELVIITLMCIPIVFGPTYRAAIEFSRRLYRCIFKLSR